LAISPSNAAFSLDAATLTVVHPSRGGRTAVFEVVPPVAASGVSSRVVNHRIPMINSTPAMIAAMIGTALLRLRAPDG
jgi:hypothetical protein